jgi:hypothetical protein
MALAMSDPVRSLEVSSEALGLARQLGLKSTFPDAGDSLGPIGVFASAEEAFGFPLTNVKENGDEVIKALWAFARKKYPVDDLDILLDSLGRVLSKMHDYPRAAGVASLITSPLRQARLCAAIAAAQSGKSSPD